MMFKNKIGCNINMQNNLDLAKQLFCETGGYIIEIEKKSYDKTTKILKENNVYYENIGVTNDSSLLNINDKIIIEIEELYKKWKFGLRDKLK